MQTVLTSECRKTAAKLAGRQDHVLTRFRQTPHPNVLKATCTSCDMEVYLETHADGFTTIYGNATREHCAPQSRPVAKPLTISDLPRITAHAKLYHLTARNADGTPLRYRMASVVKRWKTQPDRFRFSLKYGFSARTIIITNEDELAALTLDSPDTHHFE